MTKGTPPNQISFITYLIVAIAAAILGFGLHYIYQSYRGEDTNFQAQTLDKDSLPSVTLIGERRPDFTLPDLSGQPFTIEQWDGNVILVNFWATWCPPCRKEIPTFMQLLQQYNGRGFQIVGIAIDERSAVVDFAKEIKASYPQIIAPTQGVDLSRRYGNRYDALPFSALIDREGIIRFTKAGELSHEELESLIKDLI